MTSTSQTLSSPTKRCRSTWVRLHIYLCFPYSNITTAEAAWDTFAKGADVSAHLPGFAFDGRKNLYTNQRLPFENRVFQLNVPDPRGGSETLGLNVSIQLASTIDLRVLDAFCTNKGASDEQVLAAITALQILLRVVPTQRYHQQGAGGNRFFDNDPKSRLPLKQGAELARGFFQSMRPTISGLRVNLDTAYTAFVKGGPGMQVALALVDKLPRGGGPPANPFFTDRDVSQLRQKLRGAEFVMHHG